MALKLYMVIAGGQTGADQGALDAGLELGLRTGGWVPKGRRTESGPLTDLQMRRWGLTEDSTAGYPSRTEKNILAACGTVLFGEPRSRGSLLTLSLCRAHVKPHIVNPTPEELRQWGEHHGIEVLNGAGNRASVNPDAYRLAKETIVAAFK